MIQVSGRNSTVISAYYVGRPSPLYYAERWSKELGRCANLLKT